ncbi:DUF3099 domain-containing protein [Actinacidiphila acidipaludis]|uniref:DUF3099 domain-containing protein n=1 Tax=Actinacidiphila acidipaludis TaxID=2873382 RepID=A0ABS7QCG1_9ACTN|nr:DUF3099 domain-containing protein [Streptomyces acidipaludis]MBY8880369.1 DUF3099 domain-containing protein [Streptomyces acidipaludis]
MRKQDEPGIYRITGARTGLTEDVRGRQRRYIISMSIRTVSVILTVVLWNVERPLAWATLVLGAVLPYVAVVVANAGRENTPPAMPTVVIPPPVRPALEASRVEMSGERRGQAAGQPEAERGGEPESGRPDADQPEPERSA